MAYLGGFWSDLIRDVAGDLGADPVIVAAVARAFASPTLPSIAAVQAAYRARGATAPPELMEQLYSRYYQAVRDNPVATGGNLFASGAEILPWAIGALVLVWLWKR